MSYSAIRVVVLYAQYAVRASYYDDWRDAFTNSDHFDAVSLNICASDIVDRLRLAMRDAELVVLLHSTNADTTSYLEPLVPILGNRKGLLLSFVGNEVNLPGAPISEKRSLLRRLQPDFVATQLLQEAGEYLFGDLVSRRVLAIPHALNSRAFSVLKGDAERDRDLGVRTFRYPPHLGDDDRNKFVQAVSLFGTSMGLSIEVSSERLDRDGWSTYLNSCRGTVATEAGSWYISRDDNLVDAIRDYIKGKNSGLTISSDMVWLRRLSHKLPWSVRQWLSRLLSKGPVRYEAFTLNEVPFEEIYERFFQGRSRAPVYGKCISSRHFDAIGTGTVQVLLEGRYNDILYPEEHYISVKSDYSDLPEAMERFADPGVRGRIAANALAYVLSGHTYQHRIEALYQAVTATV